jgi:hypothetical protein
MKVPTGRDTMINLPQKLKVSETLEMRSFSNVQALSRKTTNSLTTTIDMQAMMKVNSQVTYKLTTLLHHLNLNRRRDSSSTKITRNKQRDQNHLTLTLRASFKATLKVR